MVDVRVDKGMPDGGDKIIQFTGHKTWKMRPVQVEHDWKRRSSMTGREGRA
jgi:hypothetical protein